MVVFCSLLQWLTSVFRVQIIRSKAPDIKVVTLPPFTEFKRRMGKWVVIWICAEKHFLTTFWFQGVGLVGHFLRIESSELLQVFSFVSVWASCSGISHSTSHQGRLRDGAWTRSRFYSQRRGATPMQFLSCSAPNQTESQPGLIAYWREGAG